MPVEKGYLICFVPRSGSSWLADMLKRTGKLGIPHEYLHPWRLEKAARTVASLEEYLAYILESYTTPNNVWGCKVTWAHFQALIMNGKSPEQTLGFPLEYIWLDRDDRNAQAISDYKAMASGYFHSTMSKPDEPVKFDAKLINEVKLGLDADRKAFKSWFAARGIEPLAFTYEQLEEAPSEVLYPIAELLGQTIEEVPQTHLQKLSNIDDFIWSLAVDGLEPSPANYS